MQGFDQQTLGGKSEQITTGGSIGDLLRTLVTFNREVFIGALQRVGEQRGLPVIQLLVARMQVSELHA